MTTSRGWGWEEPADDPGEQSVWWENQKCGATETGRGD